MRISAAPPPLRRDQALFSRFDGTLVEIAAETRIGRGAPKAAKQLFVRSPTASTAPSPW